MGIGIKIVNESNYTQVESDTVQYPNIFSVFSGESSAASGTPIPSFTDLVFARPSDYNGRIYYNPTNNTVYSSTGFYNYWVFRQTTGGGFTPNTGYGLNVFNSSSQCIFSATSTNFAYNLEIIVSLSNAGNGTTVYYPMPNATYSISNNRTYILLNSTCYDPTYGLQQSFWFQTSGYTYGAIALTSQIVEREYPQDLIYDYDNGNNSIIAYIRG